MPALDTTAYAPLILYKNEGDSGGYTLMLSDSEMDPTFDVFEDNGRLGNGYAWADVALQVMRTRDPALEGEIEMDPEAGTFVAYGTNLDALQKLAALLHHAFHNHAVLADLVRSAPYEYD